MGAQRRGASGARPVERRWEIMENVADGLPAISLIPASKLKVATGDGGRTSEVAGPSANTTGEDAFDSYIPYQQAPAPTAFTERFQEVDKMAEKSGEDVAEKVRGMTLEENPGLTVPK